MGVGNVRVAYLGCATMTRDLQSIASLQYLSLTCLRILHMVSSHRVARLLTILVACEHHTEGALVVAASNRFFRAGQCQAQDKRAQDGWLMHIMHACRWPWQSSLQSTQPQHAAWRAPWRPHACSCTPRQPATTSFWASHPILHSLKSDNE